MTAFFLTSASPCLESLFLRFNYTDTQRVSTAGRKTWQSGYRNESYDVGEEESEQVLSLLSELQQTFGPNIGVMDLFYAFGANLTSPIYIRLMFF